MRTAPVIARFSGLEREFGRALTKLPEWASSVASTDQIQGHVA